jgi:hypothetical protein
MAKVSFFCDIDTSSLSGGENSKVSASTCRALCAFDDLEINTARSDNSFWPANFSLLFLQLAGLEKR